jgi:hypothetical protein
MTVRRHEAVMAGFAGMEKTADWETAVKGLVIGGALGGGMGFGGAKAIVHLVEKHKGFAALIGGIIGATAGVGLGAAVSKPAPPPQMIQHGTYAGLPAGTTYRGIVT